MKRIAATLVLCLIFCDASGRRVRRGYDNSGYVSGGSGRERDIGEQDASVSGESIGECGGNVGKGYDSPELGYNREGRTTGDEHQVAGGHAYSKASATASASSSSYNMNHKANIIPV